jgi:hypothetical protein
MTAPAFTTLGSGRPPATGWVRPRADVLPGVVVAATPHLLLNP